jgi:hypothetical protein
MARKQPVNLYLSADAYAILKTLAAAEGLAPSVYLEQQLMRIAARPATPKHDHAHTATVAHPAEQ